MGRSPRTVAIPQISRLACLAGSARDIDPYPPREDVLLGGPVGFQGADVRSVEGPLAAGKLRSGRQSRRGIGPEQSRRPVFGHVFEYLGLEHVDARVR